MEFTSRSLMLGLVLLCCGTIVPGCARLRLPAIDPSGERIFLPAPVSTTIESCLPKPAFSAPPEPQPCPAVTAIPVDPFHQSRVVPVGGSGPIPGGRNQLRVNPARLIATVNTEVVLVAGYCSCDGYFITKQPIEWILPHDSVGHFVDVGKASHDYLAALLHEKPRKLSANYAVGMTSTKEFRITRGSPSPFDDVRVAKGQAWISLTSATEGTSHVSVIAPKAENWDQRRQTATIHWIDVQWALPPPAVGRAGEAMVLSSQLTRATNGSPIRDWIVRYELPEGAPATLESDAIVDRTDRAVEVSTDTNGQANVVVRPQSEMPGSYPLSIQIIRPALGSGDLPRTVLGNSSTSVTWSAPGLSVRVSGGGSYPVGTHFPLRIEVSNVGDMPARGIVVTGTIPPHWRFLQSTPNGRVLADRVEWEIGDLPGLTSRAIDIQVEAIRSGDARFAVRAQSLDGLLAEDEHDRVQLFEPALAIEIIGPDSAEIGSDVQYRVEITNRSDQRLTNVRVVDRFDPAFSHVSQAGQAIERSIPVIEAGDTVPIELTFRLRDSGNPCHTVQATADGGHTASARACLRAVVPPGGLPARSKVQVRLNGPTQARTGQTIRYQVDVENVSRETLNNVRLVVDLDRSLQPKAVTAGLEPGVFPLTWDLRTVYPGQRKVYNIDCLCLNPSQVSSCRVRVTANPNLSVEDRAELEIVDAESGAAAGGAAADDDPDPGRDNPRDTGGDDPQRNGAAATADGLALTLGLNGNPIQFGETSNLVIEITNRRDVEDRDLVLAIRFPAGIKPESVIGFRNEDRYPPVTDPQTLVFPTIDTLGPASDRRSATRRITVTCSASDSGNFTIEVQARSRQNPVGISKSTELTVLRP